MPKTRRAINAVGKRDQNNTSKEDEDKKLKIKEMKGKIKMKERRRSSETVRLKTAIAENEAAIAAMRTENHRMRDSVRKALDMDEMLVSDALCGRKRERLALIGKTTEGAISEIDQTVCDNARRLNELVHQRQLRLKKLKNLGEQLKLNAQALEYVPDSSPAQRARQLENAISKVHLKTSTAFGIKGVYTRIKAAVEDQLSVYPKKLDHLEKVILSQRRELEELKKMQSNAFAEREETTNSKTELEFSVREERKEREITLRQMRRRVNEIASMFEFPHTSRKVTRDTAEAQRHMADCARRTQERLDRIKEYQEKANMLEIVTGIPFVNEEGIVNCLRNQKNSSEYLGKQTKINQKLLLKNKKLQHQQQMLYNKLKYEHERSLQEKIEDMQNKENEMLARKRKVMKTNSEFESLLLQVHGWLEPIVTRVWSACQDLNHPNISRRIDEAYVALKNRTDEGEKILDIFDLFVNLLIMLSEIAAAKGQAEESASTAFPDEDAISEKSGDMFAQKSNNRILSKLEKKVSEDFEYNTPSNDAYLSREQIKRQAESRQRGKR